ncbi:HelD family protein [Streptomyces xantholiticus]|uniref:HelD family protein n=1 Tax=Streptomyces xantholiticus TaxID=68285 RepID=UPI00167C22D2|nr:AAA family ATPase [Streptomyces xantholiticus]GGW72375.1 DNA helicase [Streptomyces xantholiticus]
MTPQDRALRSEIKREQEYVSVLYRRVDGLREETTVRLAEVLRGSGGTPQARTERDAAYGRLSDQLARLDAAENGLCFGRLDLRGGGLHYIGRVGLPAESAEGDPLLVDWRAPAARPFYVATAAAPLGVHRRRHIVTRGRRVVELDDEVLDGEADVGGEGLAGEAALLAAVNAGRSGRMHDIVATLQAEQDAIIRSDHRGVLVVQGGPGTGKTAVALHRAAYLLYNRPRLAAQGVLVVGPTATFLTYIGQVLPGLGESSVLLSTVAELFPGVTAERAESAAAAEVKGRAVMAEVIAEAVRAKQVPHGTDLLIGFDTGTLRLGRDTCVRAAERARATGLPHNQARQVFAREITGHLARSLAEQTRQLADRLEDEIADVLAEADVDRAVQSDLASLEVALENTTATGVRDVLDGADIKDLHRELSTDPGVRVALDALWPQLTPQRLLEELFADPARLARTAPRLSDAERSLLVRAPGGWSPADVPLLDEAAELLGIDEHGTRAQSARWRAQEVAYAQGVLDIAAGSQSAADGATGEVLTAGDLLDADRLAERHRQVDHATVAERAAADRAWTFGHVIVDEAQELSQMAWRLLMRRCPSRSMTVVGDVAQTSDAAGTTSWDRVLHPYVGTRWRLTRLSVNYRTPAEIMDATTDLLTELDPGTEPPTSVRKTGMPPWRLGTPAQALPTVLAEHARREVSVLGDGRLAVIVPDARTAELAAAVASALPEATSGPHPDLTARAVVLGVGQTKGLEFDSVIIADPAGILTASPRGRNDLYVAMTRATQRLGILHTGMPPTEIVRTTHELAPESRTMTRPASL